MGKNFLMFQFSDLTNCKFSLKILGRLRTPSYMNPKLNLSSSRLKIRMLPRWFGSKCQGCHGSSTTRNPLQVLGMLQRLDLKIQRYSSVNAGLRNRPRVEKPSATVVGGDSSGQIMLMEPSGWHLFVEIVVNPTFQAPPKKTRRNRAKKPGKSTNSDPDSVVNSDTVRMPEHPLDFNT